jgi:4-hydroxy-3-methylbut-2-enyl diphosphate reductase
VLKGIKTIGVTAGASTPSILVKQVGDFLEQFVYDDKNTWKMPNIIPMDRLIPKTTND